MAQPFEYPPTKRVRMDEAGSPHPVTPYASSPSPITPQIQTPQIQLPIAPNPYSFNTPQPIHMPGEMAPPIGTPGGVMGPPQRPADKPVEKQGRDQGTDMNALTDVMFGTGVNLKDEEAAMQASYRDSLSQSFGSFNTQTTGTITPSGSFGASQPYSFPSSGLSSQRPVSQQSIDDELAARHKQVARQYNERKSAPLYDPFLQMNTLRIKVQDKAYDNGVKTDLGGVYYKNPDPGTTSSGVAGVGPDGIGVIAAAAHHSPSSWLAANAQLTELLSLLSLAANERLRNITEDAYELARNRQANSHGVVDPNWTSLATGGGKASNTSAVPLSVTKTAWDRQPGTVVPSKRPLEDSLQNHNRLPTPPSEPSPTPKPTVSYANNLATVLRGLSQEDHQAEEARIAKRQKRQNAAKAAAAPAAPDGATNGVDASPATPGSTTTPGTPINAIAPDLAKLTKKERERQNKQQTEDVLHASANTAASMALGGGRKFSWMSSGAKPPPAARTNTSVGAPTAAATAGRVPAGAPVQEGMKARDRKIGSWKEDGKYGKGIQLRDLTHVLEHDGKAKRTVARILMRMSSKDEMQSTEYMQQ
ncbi:hypothetical protein NA57DRAFT_82110 [Rhizodiscina lignyota]|uniref:Transcription initiation factor TFIID subunit 4 n=1 Tax=Rhizodiscina lignyota TaxID=1504668 RepID=A0A9P4I5D1_9PEZI|nr:hypothetical protein NA57DRAFT_82110 [Rhizodiscina lignyota]